MAFVKKSNLNFTAHFQLKRARHIFIYTAYWRPSVQVAMAQLVTRVSADSGAAVSNPARDESFRMRADECRRMTVLYLFLPIGGGRATGLPSNFDVCVNAPGRRHGAVLVNSILSVKKLAHSLWKFSNYSQICNVITRNFAPKSKKCFKIRPKYVIWECANINTKHVTL